VMDFTYFEMEECFVEGKCSMFSQQMQQNTPSQGQAIGQQHQYPPYNPQQYQQQQVTQGGPGYALGPGQQQQQQQQQHHQRPLHPQQMQTNPQAGAYGAPQPQMRPPNLMAPHSQQQQHPPPQGPYMMPNQGYPQQTGSQSAYHQQQQQQMAPHHYGGVLPQQQGQYGPHGGGSTNLNPAIVAAMHGPQGHQNAAGMSEIVNQSGPSLSNNLMTASSCRYANEYGIAASEWFGKSWQWGMMTVFALSSAFDILELLDLCLLADIRTIIWFDFRYLSNVFYVFYFVLTIDCYFELKRHYLLCITTLTCKDNFSYPDPNRMDLIWLGATWNCALLNENSLRPQFI
jgi:hypothetical protein